MSQTSKRDNADAQKWRESERHIFVAEDDPEMRRLVADKLRKIGHTVIEAADGAELMHRLAMAGDNHQFSQMRVDLIITDIRMPGSDGLAILESLRASGWRTPAIVMSAFGDSHARERAEGLGAVFLDKPFRMDLLIHTVRRLLE